MASRCLKEEVASSRGPGSCSPPRGQADQRTTHTGVDTRAASCFNADNAPVERGRPGRSDVQVNNSITAHPTGVPLSEGHTVCLVIGGRS